MTGLFSFSHEHILPYIQCFQCSTEYRGYSDHEKIINENNDKQRKDLSTLLHYFGILFMTPGRPITWEAWITSPKFESWVQSMKSRKSSFRLRLSLNSHGPLTINKSSCSYIIVYCIMGKDPLTAHRLGAVLSWTLSLVSAERLTPHLSSAPDAQVSAPAPASQSSAPAPGVCSWRREEARAGIKQNNDLLLPVTQALASQSNGRGTLHSVILCDQH